MNTENYQTQVIQRLLILINTLYVFHFHDVYLKDLTEGDVDDLMAILFLKKLINDAKVNFSHAVIYLTNSNPLQLLDAYPELDCDELIFISSETNFDFDILVSNAYVLGWLAQIKGKDKRMLEAVLKRDPSALNFSQGYPIPPPSTPSSYNFKNLEQFDILGNGNILSKLQTIFSQNYGESTQIPTTELESFIPPHLLQSISKFAILRLIAMPQEKFAAGLVSVQYGRGNNLRMLLKYLDQLLQTNHFIDYESMKDKEAKLQFVKDLVNNYQLTLTPMIENYYNDFVQRYSFEDINESFLDGLKILSWFYQLGVCTTFESMPTIAYGYNYELNPSIKVEDPFSYDLTATILFYIFSGIIEETVIREMGITMRIK